RRGEVLRELLLHRLEVWGVHVRARPLVGERLDEHVGVRVLHAAGPLEPQVPGLGQGGLGELAGDLGPLVGVLGLHRELHVDEDHRPVLSEEGGGSGPSGRGGAVVPILAATRWMCECSAPRWAAAGPGPLGRRCPALRRITERWPRRVWCASAVERCPRRLWSASAVECAGRAGGGASRLWCASAAPTVHEIADAQFHEHARPMPRPLREGLRPEGLLAHSGPWGDTPLRSPDPDRQRSVSGERDGAPCCAVGLSGTHRCTVTSPDSLSSSARLVAASFCCWETACWASCSLTSSKGGTSDCWPPAWDCCSTT